MIKDEDSEPEEDINDIMIKDEDSGPEEDINDIMLRRRIQDMKMILLILC